MNRIELIRNHFSDIISDVSIENESKNSKRILFRATLYFTNSSKLAVNEVLIFLAEHSKKRKYAFQWMDYDNTLIIRWDNSPHFPSLDNYPHHKHIENNTVPSSETTLFEVLQYIRHEIKQH